jgi:hypothetical protein
VIVYFISGEMEFAGDPLGPSKTAPDAGSKIE